MTTTVSFFFFPLPPARFPSEERENPSTRGTHASP